MCKDCDAVCAGQAVNGTYPQAVAAFVLPRKHAVLVVPPGVIVSDVQPRIACTSGYVYGTAHLVWGSSRSVSRLTGSTKEML